MMPKIHNSEQGKICFFISPIGHEGSPQRKRSDQIVKHILEPVLKDFEFKTIRADQIQKPGLIAPQVFQHILTDDLAVADLSDANPNVYYELALRHAARRPCIQFISEEQELPFDINQSRTIHYNLADLDTVERTKELLKNQVASISQSNYRIESPITFAIELNSLRGSDDAQKRAIGDILLELQELKNAINSQPRKLDFPAIPLCEKCGKNPAKAFCWFDTGGKGEWKFCCNCSYDQSKYDISFERFFFSPTTTIDWLAHLNNKKRWIDWTGFMNMMERFRHATNSYNKIAAC